MRRNEIHNGSEPLAQRISRDKLCRWLLLVNVLVLSSTLQAQERQAQESTVDKKQQEILRHPGQIAMLFKSKTISAEQLPNPHWDTGKCTACHEEKPDNRGLHLRNKDIDLSCNNCHSVITSHSCIHPSAIEPSDKMIKRMGKGFLDSVQQTNGKLSCMTCHDLSKQCLPEHSQQKQLNPLFFREGPYRERTEICFQCHDDEAYARLNPHDQVTDEGQKREQRCGICHSALGGLTSVSDSSEVDFNVTGNLSQMCTRCHQWKPHPGASFSFGKKKNEKINHLVSLPDDMKKYFLEKQEESHIRLPLEPGSGKIYCATCHNPHETGIIKNVESAAGADSKDRLRAKDICIHCHDK